MMTFFSMVRRARSRVDKMASLFQPLGVVRTYREFMIGTVLSGTMGLFLFEGAALGAIQLAGDNWSDDGVPTLVYQASDGWLEVHFDEVRVSALDIQSEVPLFRAPFPIVAPPGVVNEKRYVNALLAGQQGTLTLPKGVIGLGRSDLSQAITASGNTFPFGRLVNLNLSYVPLGGDFDFSGSLSLADVDLIGNAIVDGAPAQQWDVNGDGRVDAVDGNFWVAELRRTWVGDANLNGVFDTEDLVQVFAAGTYEDARLKNSAWQTGDWDWDGDFTASDLIVAFQDGGYNQGTRPIAVAIPEPSSGCLILTLFTGAIFCRARRPN